MPSWRSHDTGILSRSRPCKLGDPHSWLHPSAGTCRQVQAWNPADVCRVDLAHSERIPHDEAACSKNPSFVGEKKQKRVRSLLAGSVHCWFPLLPLAAGQGVPTPSWVWFGPKMLVQSRRGLGEAGGAWLTQVRAIWPRVELNGQPGQSDAVGLVPWFRVRPSPSPPLLVFADPATHQSR